MDNSFLNIENNFFYELFNRHNSIMLLIEPESGKILKANLSAQKFYGYSESEFENLVISDINMLSPELIKQERLKALKEARNFFIFTHKLSSGDHRTVEVHSSPIRINDKEFLFSIINDITKQKKLEERYQSVVSSMAEGIVVQNHAGSIVSCNHSAEKILGLTKDQLMGRTSVDPRWKSIKEDGSTFLGDEHPAMEALKTGLPVNDVIMGIHKENGELTWISINAQPLVNYTNKLPYAVVTTFYDVTNLKLTIDKQKISQERLNYVLNNSGMCLWDWDLKNSKIFYSSNWKEMLGYYEDEILDSIEEWTKRINPEDLSSFNQSLVDLKNRKSEFLIHEHRLLDKHGLYLWFSCRAKIAEFSEDGQPLRIIGSHRDINIRKENSFKLESDIEYSKKLFSSTMAGIVIVDAKTRKIVDANQVALDILECTHDDLIDKPCIDFICSRKDSTCEVCEFQKAVYNQETEVTTNNKTKKSVIKSINILNHEGNDFLIESFIDITAIKEQQEEIKRLMDNIISTNEIIEDNLFEKNVLIDELDSTRINLENSLKEKDKFFSIIAHDLKSPFSGLLGLSKMMIEQLYDLKINELEEYLIALESSTINLYKLLENLLEWSRMQRGLISYNPLQINLKSFTEDVFQNLKNSANNKSIDFKILIDEEIYVNADYQMLNGILRNLISNAIKFTPENGEIRIKCTLAENNFYKIEIKDSGIGIPEEMIDKLFVVGEKTNRPGTSGEASTGLGLVICKEFIEKHNGRIWVESEIDKGSSFIFLIPAFKE
jgi:PAS domain S-box-containing protein